MCQARNGKNRNWKETGKERVLSFPVPPFLGTRFFPVFGQNHEKQVKKKAERPKNGWKDVERGRTAVLRCSNSRIWRDPIFLYHLKPVSALVPMPFLPLSFPVLIPFLYRFAIIPRCTPVAAQPLDHIGPSLDRGTSGRFVFMASRCYGPVCAICLLLRMGVSEVAMTGRRRRWVHPMTGRKEDSMGQTKRGGGAEGATPNRKCQQ